MTAVRTLVPLALLGLGLVGCPESQPPRSTAPDPDASHEEEADAGLRVADAGEPDAARSGPRRLVEVPLFEGVGPHDRLVAPRFDPATEGWGAIGEDGGPAVAHRRWLARTPAGQAALEVPPPEAGASATLVYGLAELSRGPLTASVWLGQDEDVPEPAGTSAAIWAFCPGDPDAADSGMAVHPLTPDPGSTRVIDGIRWTRHIALLPDTTVGWGALTIRHEGPPVLWIAGASIAEP